MWVTHVVFAGFYNCSRIRWWCVSLQYLIHHHTHASISHPPTHTGNICTHSPPVTSPTPTSDSTLLLVVRLSVSNLERGRRGGWEGEERRRHLMFNWKRYAGFSLICTRKCRLSHSLSLSYHLLLPTVSSSFSLLSLVPFFVSTKCTFLRLVRPLFLPPLRLSFPSSDLSSLPVSFSTPSARSDLLLCFSLMLECKSTYACALIHASVLECHHICLLCEFDTSKGCHKLNKSIPCSVLHWQN